MLFNVDDNFTAANWIGDAYRSIGASDMFTTSSGLMDASDLEALIHAARKQVAR